MSSQIKLNNAIEFPPIGCIVAYMGTVAPEGWIFCDGVQRTNGQDGRYNNLIAAKIGSVTATGTYMPPSLFGKFLRGANTATNVGFDTTNKLIGGGSNTVTLITNNLPSHNHDVTDPGHTHDVTDPGHSHGANTYRTSYRSKGYRPLTSVWGDWCSALTLENNGRPAPNLTFKTTVNIGTTGCTIDNTTPIKMSSTSTGISEPVTIIPSYINVNYIIKY